MKKNPRQLEMPEINADLQRQRDYVKYLDDRKFEYGLVLAHTFVKGMRDIGYKSTAYALNELSDNAIQASAKSIHVAFGYLPGNPTHKRPDTLAVIDDGHGMDPGMIRASVLWGGTHRHDDRKGFGRYGYGLPSACVSIGKRFSVFSRVEGGSWYKVTVDLDEIERHFANMQSSVRAEEPKAAEPPDWVRAYIGSHYRKFTAGTVILIEKIDRLDYWPTDKLRAELRQDFGVTYRNFLRSVTMTVDGEIVEPTDPLFLTEGFRYYDVDQDRAEGLPPSEIPITSKESGDSLGVIKVRYSYMAPSFLRVEADKKRPEGRGTKPNARMKVRKANNGLIVLRQGRQIDVVSSKCPWTTFQNNDKYLGIEVDFPPTLDEEFTITTSKQQIEIKPRIWDLLEQHGVYRNIKAMRARWDKENNELKHKDEDTEGKRPSETAMESARPKFAQVPAEQTPAQKQKSEDNLNREVDKLAAQTGLPKPEAKVIVEAKTNSQKFKVEYFDAPGAPFYRVEPRGAQVVLLINKGHLFYNELYASPFSTPHVRYALEGLLFVMGDCELSANEDRQAYYEQERQAWSVNLSTVLRSMDTAEAARDAVASASEQAEANDLEKQRTQSLTA